MTTHPDYYDTASTILAQLGGNRFAAMTGAKDFLTTGNGLQLSLPARFAAQGINRVRVNLDPCDTYTVTFFKIARRGMDVKVVKELAGVYADQLRGIFTATTGLATSI